MKHFIRELRTATRMTQKEFATKYRIPLSTLRKWEQGESFPADYIVSLIEATIPEFDKRLEKIIGDSEDEVYYIDRAMNKVSDSKGNWISFTESLDGVNMRNIVVYLRDAFEDFYKLQKDLNRELRLDKIEKIEWR